MFVINYEKFLSEKEVPAFIKELIRTIQNKGLVHPGQWIRNLSTVDLLSISNSIRQVRKAPPPMDPSEDQVGDLPIFVGGSYILLIDLLASAEGLDVVHEVSVFKTRATLLESYISAETLSRRKFDVKIMYENMSLSEEIRPDEKPVLEVGPKFQEQIADQMLKALEKEIATYASDFPEEPEVKAEDKAKAKAKSEPEAKPSILQRGKSWLDQFKNSKGNGEHEI